MKSIIIKQQKHKTIASVNKNELSKVNLKTVNNNTKCLLNAFLKKSRFNSSQYILQVPVADIASGSLAQGVWE